MSPEQRPPSPAAEITAPFGFLARLSPRALIWSGALGAAVVAIFFFAPRFWLWRALGVPPDKFIAIQPEFYRAFFTLQQLRDPWGRIDDVTNRVIEWRLLFPTFGHYLALPPAIYFALPHLGCVLALAAIASVVWRATADALFTVGAALLCATLSWFFVSTGWLGYFDSWLMLALVLASFACRRWVLCAVALLTPWVDERFVLALPLCLAVRALGSESETRDPRAWWGAVFALLGGLVPYVAVRLGAEIFHVRATSQNYWANRPLLPASLGVMAWAVWCGLRLGWAAVIPAVRAGWRERRWLSLGAVAASLLVNLVAADDLSRSVSIAMPVLVAGLLRLRREQSRRARVSVFALVAGNLLLPAEHVIASAGSEESPYHRIPVLSLGAELARADDPPFFASPFAYTRRGTDAWQAGNQEAALAFYDLALRFDPEFPRAHANRGILLFLRGQRDAGMAELDAALAKAPWIYEARIERAKFRYQLGNLPGALEDVRRALRDIPADWPRRLDTEQFARALAAELDAARVKTGGGGGS